MPLANLYILILSLLLFQSCSSILGIEEDKIKFVSVNNNHKKFCVKNLDANKPQLLSDNQFIKTFFLKRVHLVKPKLNQIEIFSILTLLNLNLRPDIINPTSGLQILIKFDQKKDYEYFTFNQKNSKKHPLFNSLQVLLKNSKSRLNLLAIAKLTIKLFPPPYQVSYGLANSLFKQKDELKKHPRFLKSFFKSNQVLQESESYKGVHLLKIVKKYLSSKEIINFNINNYQKKLIPSASPNTIKLMCNQKLRSPQDGQSNTTKDDGSSNLPLAFSMAKNQNLMAVIKSSSISKAQPFMNSSLFKTRPTDAQATFCTSNQKLQDLDIKFLSIKGRDSSQFLKIIQDIGPDQLDSAQEISSAIEFARTLYLKKPNRVIIESNRSNKVMDRKILSSSIPVYHARTLGELWAFRQQGNIKNYIRDSRSTSHLSCLETIMR